MKSGNLENWSALFFIEFGRYPTPFDLKKVTAHEQEEGRDEATPESRAAFIKTRLQGPPERVLARSRASQSSGNPGGDGRDARRVDGP